MGGAGSQGRHLPSYKRPLIPLCLRVHTGSLPLAGCTASPERTALPAAELPRHHLFVQDQLWAGEPALAQAHSPTDPCGQGVPK